jgi:uncharacterized Fe-S center protein
MPAQVFFGSPRQARLDAKETLPAKLDLILERLHVHERVKDETVVIKMHTGNNIGYSTVHPVFVRKVIQAVKEGGGKPFIADVNWDVKGAEERGYSSETLDCPVYPAAGPDDKYFYRHERPYKNIREWHVAGMIQDATFLINLAHAKGHPSCGYGGAFKNVALGCMAGDTRSAMHDTMHYDRYWFADKCPDEAARKRIIEVCPHAAIVEDRDNPADTSTPLSTRLHLHPEECNYFDSAQYKQCGRCLEVAPPGSLKIDPINFHSFQEACAISTSITLSTFAPGKATHIVLATQMTPVCDCFGFTSMPILRLRSVQVLPDAGIFGSDDIVAVDRAVLDVTGRARLIEENVPILRLRSVQASMEVHTRVGHPLRWLHGPLKDPYLVTEYGAQLGLGSRDYELVDVLPVEEFVRPVITYIPAR